MTKHRFLLGAVIVAALVTAALAADVTGTWTAAFDTQVGAQQYTYTFKVDGNKLTGTAKSQLAGAETPITEGMVNGDDISFVENLNYQGMPLKIVYKGKIAGDEIKFTRTVADMFMEELVAKRAK
jgi:opacity protein-like surface antigen